MTEKIFDLISTYYQTHDYVIEYLPGNRVNIKKDMLIGYDPDKTLLYYYADDDLDKPPIGVIRVSAITAIKRTGYIDCG